MAASSRNRNRLPNRWVRLILWAIPILFVLLIITFFVAKSAIDSYLRSDGFRQFVAHKAGETMHADAEVTPLSFAGSNIFADDFRAQGGPDAAFANLDVEQIRTEVSLRRFLKKCGRWSNSTSSGCTWISKVRARTGRNRRPRL